MNSINSRSLCTCEAHASEGPEMDALNLRIYKALEGAIDIQCHTDPDCVPRLLTDREVVAQARAVGMRAILMKCHTSQSAARTAALQETVGRDFDVCGVICLNPALGGINPEAVKYAIRMGVKGVWMPSMWSDHNVKYIQETQRYLREVEGLSDEQLRIRGKMGDESIGTIFGNEGVSVVTEQGSLKPELIRIMEMVAEADIMLATGHVSCEHAHMILDAANEIGIKKLVVHTCNYHVMNYPLEDLHKMVAKNGAYVEFGFSSLPNPIWLPVKMERLWDMNRIVEAMRVLGPGRCILSTDAGQFTTTSPIECIRLWGELLKARGFSDGEIDLMSKVNPAIVLGLEPSRAPGQVSKPAREPAVEAQHRESEPRTMFHNSEDIRQVERYSFPWKALNLRTYRRVVDAIDISVHTAPDAFPRLLTDREAVAQAKAVRMRAVVLKCHTSMTADRAAGVKEVLDGGIEVFGGICLNPAVGGFNPHAVEHAINMGIRCVWMPTLWSSNHVRKIRSGASLMGYETLDVDFGEQGLSILSGNGEIKEEVVDILKMIADADIMLGTGNISCNEAHVLLDKANDIGVRKLVVSNANDAVTRYPIKDLEKMARQNGAFIELGHRSLPYPIWWESVNTGERLETLDDVCQIIRAIGVDRCILSSDSGQVTTALPIECMRMWPELLKVRRFSAQDVDTMMKVNPATVLGLGAAGQPDAVERKRRTIDDVIEAGAAKL